MEKLFFLNKLRWYLRLPIKWAVFGLTVLFVCFPYPSLLVRHIRHGMNPNALVEPDAPALQPFVDELRPRMTNDLAPRAALKLVERFVYEKIQYEWDWNTWGVADYLPTVTEAIEMGKEDCDGQAVVAASLLSYFGFKAELVTDFAHMWVKTDKGETMSPGKRQVVVATEDGFKVQFQALGEFPKAAAYGVAVFPATRELIIIAMLWLLLLRRHGGVVCGVAGLSCLLGGLFLLRAGGVEFLRPIVWMQWSGFSVLIAGIIMLFAWASHNARQSRAS